jgi:DNA polymerase I
VLISHQELWMIDTEWGFHAGRLDQESAWEPVVFCAVGLRSGRHLYFWGRDHRLLNFIRERSEDLFVGHYVIAEMKYLLRLGISLPPSWFDTFVAWRYRTNAPKNLEAGLSVALHHLSLPHLAPAAKDALRRKIVDLEFDANNPADRREVIEYCFSDCDGCGELYRHIHHQLPPATMAHWMEYAKAVARMELRGLPIDIETYDLIHQQRPEIREALIGDVNQTWPVLRGDSFSKAAFFAWCEQTGIAWPVETSMATGKLYRSLKDETFKEMETRHPFIGGVRQVRKTLSSMGKRTLAIDPVGRRHYFSTSVFRSVTGRNQPKKFIFSGPKWLRFLLVPESPDHVMVYVDYTAQEVGLAAALSEDEALRAIYETSDCHMAFAVRAGAAPPGATKKTHATIRKRYKTVCLGVQYGQTSYGISHRLGISFHDAEVLIGEHKRLFPKFWDWSERVVQGAFDRGWIKTPCGWCSRVPFNSNERTWMNWPMQSTGGDIMRLTVTYLDRQSVRILAPVHDGFVLSCRRDQLPDLRAAVDYACQTAIDHVVPGFPLRWDFTVYEKRFEDEDGLPLWNRLMDVLKGTPVSV